MNRRRPTRLRRRIALGLCSSVLFSLFLEGGFRLVRKHLGIRNTHLARIRSLVVQGKPPAFESRPYTTFGRRERGFVTPRGYTGDELSVERTPGTIRIACLGASTTLSGNKKGNKGSYPYFLREILTERTGDPVEVMNWGVPGWTTAETLINYMLRVQDYDPDVVILHHAVKTEVGFLRNVRTVCEHVRLRGGTPILATMPYNPDLSEVFPNLIKGIRDNNRILLEYAESDHIPLVDLCQVTIADLLVAQHLIVVD